MLKTEWLPTIGVPAEARHISTDPEPENGIVTVSPAADGTVTPNEREGGRTFKIYTNGDVTALIMMSRTPNGGYKVSGLDHC